MPPEPVDQPRIFQVPIPGGSGRVPTGAMQFRGDWPGLFLRGDTALMVGRAIRQLDNALATSEDPAIRFALSRLVPIADIIDRDVLTK